MKKFMMILSAAFLLASGAAAQSFDPAAQARRLSGSDAEIADPAKASKAKTWQTRGDVYLEAAQGMGTVLFRGMPLRDLSLMVSQKPASTSEKEIQGSRFKVLSYPGTDVYTTMGDTVAFWKAAEGARPDAAEVSLAAYRKAIELDPKMERRVAGNMKSAMNQLRQEADFAYIEGDLPLAARGFGKVYDNSTPPVFTPDTLAAFNAASLFTNLEDYDQAIRYFLECLKYDFDDEGKVYSFLYNCYQAKGEKENAGAILERGVQKYPDNAVLLENLIAFYHAEGKDPGQIVSITEQALAKDPNNPVYHYSMGILYKNLGEAEKAEASLKQAMELNPDDYAAGLHLAELYLTQAEKAQQAIQDIPVNEQARQDEKLAEMNDYYHRALPLLEKTHTSRPELLPVVETLRSIYFRFREESPEMMQNYTKYNDIFNSMTGR